MCGIVGYTGQREAYPVLLDALERLEYRGYDSCGVALRTPDGIRVAKSIGMVELLRRGAAPIPGTSGIGHTRWATVGAPSLENAHPHLDCSGRVAIAHNGEIDNFAPLRQRLLAEGHTMASATDSEVLAHLVERHLARGPVGAVVEALGEVRGTYAMAVLFRDTGVLVGARRENPLVLGLGNGEHLMASDTPAIVEHAGRVIYLDDGDVAALHPRGFQVFHNQVPVTRRVHQVPMQPEELGKAGYEHYFLKEVHEQPRVLRDTMAGRVTSTDPRVSLGLEGLLQGPPSRVLLAGCGSAYHAALAGAQLMGSLSSCHVSAMVASEVESLRPADRGSLAVFLSQSGETADTVAAARSARSAGYATLALTNTPGSSIARVASATLESMAGPEVSVAASKTFLAQVVDLYMLGMYLFPPTAARFHALLKELRLLPARVQQVLAMEEELAEAAALLAGSQSAYLIGSGPGLPVALEGSLKLKELAYLHAEAYPAGELKHGPFALLTPETPVIAVATPDAGLGRVLRAVREVRARGAPVVAIADAGAGAAEGLVDRVVRVPATEPIFAPVIAAVALQLMAYYCARERGRPIDRPRNLAKSVTVR